MPTRREFHRSVAVGVAAWAGGSLAGCTSREEVKPAGSGSSSGAAGGTSGSGAQTPAAGRTITIGMIAKSQSNPVFLAARRGAEERAAELTRQFAAAAGSSAPTVVKLDWQTPNDEDAQRQAELIEQLVAGGASAITIACSDASKVTRVIDQAVDSGVAVMCFDSDAPDSKRLCYVGTDDYEAGRQVMARVAELLGEREGAVAILAGNQTATNLQKRVRGAKEELEKHPNLKLKEVYYHKETPQDSYAMVESVQQANPEINAWAMVGGWPLMTEKPLPWKAGEVVCVSMDTLPAELEHLRIGDVQALLGQQYFYFGGQCVSLLVEKLLHDKHPEQEIDFAALDVVTAENVEEYAKNWEKWS